MYKQNRQYIGGLIKKLEFENMIDRASTLTAKVYSENRKADNEGIAQSVIYILASTTLMMLAYIFLLYYGIRDDDRRLRIAGFFLLGMSVFVTSIIGLRNFFQKPGRYTPFTAAVRKILDSVFVRENKVFKQRGIEFCVADNHYWIEIKID